MFYISQYIRLTYIYFIPLGVGMRQKKKKMGETLIIRLLMNINCMTCSDLLKSRQTWKVLDSCLHTHVKQCLKGMVCSAVVGSRV